MGKGTVFVPVRDQEKAWAERGSVDDKTEAAHRAFDNPHTLHRGSAVLTGPRDSGAGVKRGPPTMLKNEKGQWVKPDKATLARMRRDWEADQDRQMHAAREAHNASTEQHEALARKCEERNRSLYNSYTSVNMFNPHVVMHNHVIGSCH